MAKGKITDIAAEMLETYLADNGLELYHIEYVKEGKDWFLRVYIDQETGISLEDCEGVSRFLSKELDEKDPIEQNYFLEVSSPGMDRPLLKEEHFRRYEGHQVEITLYKGIDGKKKLHGVLKGLLDDHIIMIDETGNELRLPREIVAKTRLAIVI